MVGGAQMACKNGVVSTLLITAARLAWMESLVAWQVRVSSANCGHIARAAEPLALRMAVARRSSALSIRSTQRSSASIVAISRRTWNMMRACSAVIVTGSMLVYDLRGLSHKRANMVSRDHDDMYRGNVSPPAKNSGIPPQSTAISSASSTRVAWGMRSVDVVAKTNSVFTGLAVFLSHDFQFLRFFVCLILFMCLPCFLRC